MQDVSVNKHKLLKNRTLSETCNVRVKILKLMAQDGNVVLCLVDLKMENEHLNPKIFLQIRTELMANSSYESFAISSVH